MSDSSRINYGISWILVVITIGLPMVAFFVGNLLSVPDDARYWQVVAILLAVGMLITPILILQAFVGCFKRRSRGKSVEVVDNKVVDRSRPKKFVYIITGLVVLWLITGSTWWSSTFGYSQDLAGLNKSIERQNQISKQGDENAGREIYEDFLLPSARTMSIDEFVNGFVEYNKANPYSKVIRHSERIDGDVAHIDRTLMTCNDKECTSIKDITRSFRRYQYEGGHWYYDPVNVYCPRSTNYQMEPEFSRALSLIEQRYFANIQNTESKDIFNEITHCLDISYAKADTEMGGAEGLFRFVPGQSPERLAISVSPRYKSTDDLLTAVLLSHEVTHAINYIVGLESGKPLSCFEDEATAFTVEIEFLARLNKGEMSSLQTRLNTGESREVFGIVDTLIRVGQGKGKDLHEKALNYVIQNPYYQKQCQGR